MRISDWSSDVCSSDLPRSAGREYGRPPYISVDMVGGLVEGIDAPDMPVAGIFLTMTAGDEVNGHHVRHQRDIGVALRRARQSLLHRCARGVVHMNDPPEIGRASCRERVCQSV